MDPVLSYNFAEIDAVVRQDVMATSARFSAAMDDLIRQIHPLQQIWNREAAAAYRSAQARWQQSASALHEILVALGHAVRDGAADLADTDRRAARSWG